jgi:hypothetical protein
VLLLIVARKEKALYEYQTRRFAGHPGVEVILDRRGGERRRQSHPVDVERRRGDRRRHRGEPSILGFTIVRCGRGRGLEEIHV